MKQNKIKLSEKEVRFT